MVDIKNKTTRKLAGHRFLAQAGVIILALLIQLFAVIFNSIIYTATVLIFILCAIGWRHRNCAPILLFSIFSLPTPIEQVITIWLKLDYYYLVDVNNISTALLSQTLATITLLLIKPLPALNLRPAFKGRGVRYSLIILGFFIVSFLIKGQAAIGDYEAYRGNLASGSGIIEYFLFLIVIIASFEGSKTSNRIFALLIIFYVFKCALFGFRVQAIMGAMAAIFIFTPHLDTKKILLLAVLGGIVGLFLGALKHSVDIDVNSLVLAGSYIQTPHAGSMTSSTVALNHISPGLLEVMSLPLSMSLPHGLLGEIIPWAYPMVYIQKFSPTPGGMLFGVYGYLFMNAAGSILVGIAISYIADRLRPSTERIDALVMYSALAFFIFFPRWYLYDFGAYGIRTFITILLALLFLDAIRSTKLIRSRDNFLIVTK